MLSVIKRPLCPLLALLNDVKVITNRVARDQDWLFITFEARWFCGKGKGGLISEGFSSLRLKSQKIMCQISPEHYLSKRKILRRVILHLFLKIWTQVKNFLKLNHLQIFLRNIGLYFYRLLFINTFAPLWNTLIFI